MAAKKKKKVSILKSSNNAALQRKMEKDHIRVAARRMAVFKRRFEPDRPTLRQLGEEFGVSHETIRDDLKVILEAEYALDLKDIELARAEEIHKIDELQNRFHQLAMMDQLKVFGVNAEGEVVQLEAWKTATTAAQITLKAAERKHKLAGLDRPTKVEIDDKTQKPEIGEIGQRMEKFESMLVTILTKKAA